MSEPGKPDPGKMKLESPGEPESSGPSLTLMWGLLALALALAIGLALLIVLPFYHRH